MKRTKRQKLHSDDLNSKSQIRLPKDALSRVNLGQAFAEYDKILCKPDIFVKTPAVQAALDAVRSKCFFVGRRGTGKTAITYYLSSARKTAIQVHPQLFIPSEYFVEVEHLRDTSRQPFRSLVYSFRRALQDEVLSEWRRRGSLSMNRLSGPLAQERGMFEEEDFDLRLLRIFSEAEEILKNPREKEWVRQKKRVFDVGTAMDEIAESKRWEFLVLIDRIDEAWDGSDRAVIFLMALMHACVELSADVVSFRPLLFLRENVFERVRQIDNEFARLETCVVSLDWTQELLLELIERRLNLPFSTKLPLRGPTWDYFFESGPSESSRSVVFEYCQERPRDVLTYCSFAIEAAQSHKHERVTIEDLQSARKRFSDSRLKDLGDEYSENYPQLQLVLGRFYGLGTQFSMVGVDAFVRKLMVDDEVKRHCASWLYHHTAPERFLELLYNIGFMGITNGKETLFRSLGARSATPPPISSTIRGVVHPSYWDALNLREIVIGELDPDLSLRSGGLILELPGALSLTEYEEKLQNMETELPSIPLGSAGARRFEDIVGDIICLCFHYSLNNVEEKVREIDGCVIRDWIAANIARNGFWDMVRVRYDATQIIWECKNCSNLTAEDFHQASYYMSQAIGRFVVMVFRGTEINNHYYDHLKRISSDKKGLVLLLLEKDLHVFMRQARNGKVKEAHIRDIYDRTVRAIS